MTRTDRAQALKLTDELNTNPAWLKAIKDTPAQRVAKELELYQLLDDSTSWDDRELLNYVADGLGSERDHKEV